MRVVVGAVASSGCVIKASKVLKPSGCYVLRTPQTEPGLSALSVHPFAVQVVKV